MPRSLRKLLQATLAASLVALFLAVCWSGAFEEFDARVGDILLRLERLQREPPSDVLLVDIDQASLDDPQMLELAGNWPWGRAVHGELVEFLLAHQPKAIVFDLIFSEPDVFRPQSDRVLSEAVRDPRVFLPMVLAEDGYASPLAGLPPAMGIVPGPGADPQAELPLIAPKALDPAGWHTGMVNFLADDDRVGRRYWVDYPYTGWRVPSLPARVARAEGVAVPSVDNIVLHWYGKSFERVSYRDLYLASQRADPGSLPELRGRTIVIGAAAPGLYDLRPTPLGATTPGPLILATALSNLLRDDWLRPWPVWPRVLIGVFGIVAVFVAFARRVHAGRLALLLAVLTLATVVFAYWLLSRNVLWQPFSSLFAIWLAFAAAATTSYLQEKRQRDQAVQMFARFLDPNVVRSLTDGSDLARAEAGSSREISVLFSDIRGFTSLSETRPPEEVVALLNRYFDLQVSAIFEQGGTLDKFIGDAIMAFWNAPLTTPDHAVRAVRAAMGMQRQLERFKQDMREADGGLGDAFDIGIGIHSGPAVVGFLGASQRLDYTAIGDTVNLASRIEGLTKGVSRVLVSEATREACGNAFVFVDHGEFAVKGRVRPVRLFEPREVEKHGE
jgi:adenylate cyclase